MFPATTLPLLSALHYRREQFMRFISEIPFLKMQKTIISRVLTTTPTGTFKLNFPLTSPDIHLTRPVWAKPLIFSEPVLAAPHHR